MTRLFWTFFCRLARALLSLRYKIEVRGFDCKGLKSDRGTLFLPNHPSLLDPVVLFLLLWPRFQLRPIVVEYIYRTPGLRFWMKVIRALQIPNFETSVNQIKIRKAQKVVAEVSEGLRRKENFLLYPAGRTKLSARETIGGASAAHELIREYPEANIVLIRTTGFWGSQFSRAIMGRSIDLKATITYCIKKTLQSLIFFLPRRRILVEIEVQPPEFPRLAERIELNRYLEQWYNRYEDEEGAIRDQEPLQLISYSCWKQDLPKVIPPKERSGGCPDVIISAKTRIRIYAEISKIIEKPELEIRPEMDLATDLGMDSLQIAELISFVGQNYHVEDLHPEDFATVQNALEIAEGARIVNRPVAERADLPRWPDQKNRPEPFLIFGETIPEAFLRSCDAMGNFPACGDDITGVLSYRKLKLAALVLAEEFRRYPYEFIGVMLPASAAASIVILALHLAGKTPVMLNWTLGPRNLDGMCRLSGIGTVITSWQFLEKVSHVDFGALSDSIELLEDIRSRISFSKKLCGLWRSKKKADALLRSLKLHRLNKDSTAVILFTSGTEAIPKGVPLTHGNIISNLRVAMQCVEFNNRDTLYGVLPPFHSFGFSICALFPIISGIKVAFYPDPTDGFALAAGIERWKVTIFCSAPSFLKGLFLIAKNEQLMSMRYFVVGAEKCPPELYDRVKVLNGQACVVEGYGITECSPIISLTSPYRPQSGVGQLLSNLELCIIHPVTQEVLPSSSEGEFCVRGPSVFNGYLGNPRAAFIEIDGKKWYRTGDIGHVDPNGNLIISGRLKRFTKFSGEMISLGAVENAIYAELIRQQRISADVPSLAVVADERDGSKPQLILFTTFSIDLDEVNEMLRNAGFSRLVKISQIRTIMQIPLLGIGKTDYRSLQTLIV